MAEKKMAGGVLIALVLSTFAGFLFGFIVGFSLF